ncbi:tetratricopeptide repeat protein [Methylomonas sp. MgM2]
MSGFEPDFVFLHNQQSWLREAFCQALFINIELSWVSRQPFTFSWQLDIAGAGKGRLLAEYPNEVLSGVVSDTEGFVAEVRQFAKKRLITPDAENYVKSLREKYRAITLLPLGIFDRFDGCTPFFTVLDKFLSEQSGENALVLTQHPIWSLLSREQCSYLYGKYPFLHGGNHIGSQHLLPWADSVIGDFSTVATQALLFSTQVVSVMGGLSYFPRETPLRNPLVDVLVNADELTRSKMLYWLLLHYLVPEDRMFDGDWLYDFLQRAHAANRAGQPWAAYSTRISKRMDWEDYRTNEGKVDPLGLNRQSNSGGQSETNLTGSRAGAIQPDSAPCIPESNINDKTIQEEEKRAEDTKAYQKAAKFLESGDEKAAFVILKKLFEEGTECWGVYDELAAIAVKQGEIDFAKELLRLAIEKQTKPGKTRFNLANILAAQEEYDSALETLSPLLRSCPNDYDALNLVREILGKHGELSKIAWARLLADLRA